MWVWSLNWEDPLEKEMATHSIVLPGESYGQISLAGYSPQGLKETRQGTFKKESRQVEKRKSEMVLPSRGDQGRKNRSSEIAPV